MPVKPVINYKLFTDSTNNKLRFRDTSGGAWLTATLATASNPTTGEYASNVKTAMEAQSSFTFSVTYSRTTRKYTVAASSGTYLSVGWSTATASCGSMMGYTADDSGATSYVGDTTSATELKFTVGVRDYRPGHSAKTVWSESDDGKRESNYKWLDEFYLVDWSLIDVSEKDSYSLFSTGWAGKGKAFDYYPSQTGSTFYRLQLSDPSRRIDFTKEMGLDLWSWSDEFRYER